jgi:hypothetical protein
MRIARSARRIGVALLAFAIDAHALGPILHEPIPPDPAEDARLGVFIDGDLPSALSTPSGVVAAPDPHRLPSSSRGPNDSALANAPPNAKFHPDRDTHRPDVVPYEDPFTPSIAPFKRLLAFDAVDASYELSVRDPRFLPLSPRSQPAPDGSDDAFFGDLVVDLVPGQPQRIPSVGPGAKILHARAGVGNADVPVRFVHDGADNWFVVGDTSTRVRLVMELAIPRATFGGALADPSWGDLPKVAPLPPVVARAAALVAAHIGVSRALAPREALTKMVAYFRSFADSDDFPRAGEDVYLALALSKKGVCRHRSFAFLVTALGLGLPARMIANEAHAWVEVHDGSMWKRIDLGGAGRAMDAALAGTVKHVAPPDPFAWPPNATRGDDLADNARGSSSSPGGGAPGGGSTDAKQAAAQASPSTPRSPSASASGNPFAGGAPDDRPPSRVSLALNGGDARRGAPLHVHGAVTAGSDSCGHVLVEIGLRNGSGHLVPLGALATDDDGKYEGALVVPSSAPLGDYDLYARSSGDSRCGPGGAP